MKITDAFSFAGQMSGPPLWVLWAVLAAGAAFVLAWIPRALWTGWQVGRVAQRVSALRSRAPGVPVADVSRLFPAGPLGRAWSEYEATLHRIDRSGADGIPVAELRSTVAAGTVFTREALVDRRLFDEFVRHLPGVLTGLGIIGTFAGLLTGLQGFNPSEDPSLARLGLKTLLGGVEHAFYASAVAIGCAIMITLLEKLLIVRCYHAADALAMAIDALYAGGAGEDYLARLVRASEAGARGSAGLREALAEEFRVALTALARQQAAQQARSSQAIGEQVAQAVSQALAAPMRELAVAMQARPDPSSAVLAEVSEVIAALAADRADAASAQRAREERLDASVGRAASDLGAEVEHMMSRVAEAARQFTAAGQTAGETVALTAQTAQHFAQAAQGLQRTCESIEGALDRYVDARTGIDAQLQALGGLIDSVRREAGVSERLVAGLQETADSLRAAQQSSVRHLDEVNDRLAGAFDAFGSSMKGQVTRVMQQTDQHTSTAMQHLLGVVQELGLTLSRSRGH